MDDETDDEVFVSYSGLRAWLGEQGIPVYTRVHLRSLIREGRFPAAYHLSPNRIGWKLGELRAWKANRPRRVPVAA